jgi:HAE1 family hydrophobic/amphiphilic exporter-1
MTLQEAVAMALQNNLDIEIARQSVQVAQHGLFAARGVYDPVSGTTLNFSNRTNPVTSIIQGGQESVSTRTLTYNFFTDKLIERSGASIGVEFNNNRLTSSSTFTTINPQYNPTLTFSITQPLMRNFKIDSNRRQIQLLKRSLDLSDSQFRQRVIDIISSVQRAYWDLVFARRNEVIARDAVEVTRVQLQNNQKQVEAGTMAPIELRSTEAALEARKETVILAMQSITTAENALKALLIKDPNDQVWYSEVVPSDEPQFGQPTFSLEEASRLALKNRPELEQLRLQVQQNQIDQQFYKNQLKPQVDLIGLYSATGSAGTARTQAPGSPFPTSRVPERLQGGYFQALRNLASLDFPVYQVGVTISFPWRNRTAEANLGRSLAESRQLDARQRQLVQLVQIDVRNALQNVEAARQRFEAARAGRIAARAQFDGELEKFRAGLSTNFFVLERQNELATARGSEVRALTDYNKALADLQRVTGMTLVSNNVQVTALEQPANK